MVAWGIIVALFGGFMAEHGTASWYFEKGALIAKHPILFAIRLGYNTKRFLGDTASRFGYYDYPHKNICLVRMPMGGTALFRSLLCGIPGYFTRPMPLPSDIRYNQGISDQAFSTFLPMDTR